MLSLIHMLAARACHADTLRRALTGDDEARRLLSLLGVTPLDLQAIDHGRITRRKAAANEQESTADAIDRALLWMSTTPPDALSKMDAHYKALLEQSTASINELRQRLQAEIMAHDATRLRADLAEAASEHGPLTDIATLTGLPVQVVYQPTSPDEYRFSVHVPGYEGVAGPTPRQALLKMREKVVEGMPKTTPPEEVIVLGPWTDADDGRGRVRLCLNGPLQGGEGVWCNDHTWVVTRHDGTHITTADHSVRVVEDEADAEARKTYALIDVEPGSLLGTIPAWRSTYDRYHEAHWSGGFLLIDDYSQGSGACPGWRIIAATPNQPKGTTIAYGPQTGEEGKRYALAAAHALGLTGGDE